MNAIVKRAKSFLKSEDGPTATEYAVMLALIIVVAILGFIMGMTTVVLGIAIVGAVIVGVYGLVVLRKLFG